MWYHYADNYKGICLQFSNLFTDEDVERHTGLFGAVQYGNSSRVDMVCNRSSIEYVKPLFYKSREWREENEYRYIEQHSHEEQNFVYFLPEQLTAIYCGVKMQENTVHKVYSTASKMNSNIQVFRTFIADDGISIDKRVYTG